MRCEYRQLGDVAIQFIDGDRGKNYPSNNEFSNVGYCLFLNAKNVTPDGFSFGEVSFITQKKDAMLRKGKLEKNDVVLTTRGTVGNVAFYGERVLYSNVRINSGMLIIRPDPSVFCPEYVYWLFRSDVIQDQIKRFSSGTAQPQLPISSIKKFEIPLVDIKTQKEIAAILSALDEKIATNRAINENLEQQAQAIYSSMFIDNPDPAWTHGHLSDLVTVKYGKDHKKLSEGIYPVYGSGGIMRYVERPLYDKESVLIPRKGTLNNVMYVNQPFWSVDTMFYTEMKLPNVAKFVYHFVKAKDLASMNAGSAVPSMTTDILNAMEVVIPSASALEEFEALVAPMYEAMEANDVQSEALSKMRDTLLPKLMSGEIDVSTVRL